MLIAHLTNNNKAMITSELQEIIDKPITKVRRWVRDCLPADEAAQARSGYVREFSIKDGFLVHIFGWLIESYRCNKEEARKIIDAIKPWVDQNINPIENFAPIGSIHEYIPTEGMWELYVFKNDNNELSIDAMTRELEVEVYPFPAQKGQKINYTLRGVVVHVAGDAPTQCLSPTSDLRYVIQVSLMAYYYGRKLV